MNVHIKEWDQRDESAHLVLEFPESDEGFGSAHRAVVNDGGLVSAAALHVSVHGVVAHVQLPPNEPDEDHIQP